MIWTITIVFILISIWACYEEMKGDDNENLHP